MFKHGDTESREEGGATGGSWEEGFTQIQHLCILSNFHFKKENYKEECLKGALLNISLNKLLYLFDFCPYIMDFTWPNND